MCGEEVPCPKSPQPLSVCQSWHTGSSPPVSPNPPLSGPETKVPPGSKAQDGPKGFKKGHLEASMFFFKPTFLLELYIATTQELMAVIVFLGLSCLSVFLPFYFF